MLTAIALLGVLAGSSVASPGDTTRVNVDSSGTQEANGNTYDTPSISADGRYAAFQSTASNLVADDTNNQWDIFVRDRDTDDDGVFDEEGYVSTERVSVDSSETQSNSWSFDPSISADGRFVAFGSNGSNLVEGDTGSRDVFVRDRQEGTTEAVTLNNGGLDPNGPPPSINADGRFVTFTSLSPDLVTDDTNNVADIFVHDRELGTTERVNKSSDGTQANDGSDNTSWFVVEESSISADGRFVAFRSWASNLAANDSEEGAVSGDIFVRDRDTDDDGVFDEEGYVSTEMVSLSYPFPEWHANDYSFAPSISADGRFVSFSSRASDLVADDTNSVADVFVRDLQEGTTSRVSVNYDGTQVNDGGIYDQGSEYPSISADGRYVAFQSAGSVLAAGDTTGAGGLFMRDRDADADGVFDEEGAAYTQRLSRGGSSSISADGTYVAFLSTASDLVTGDTNGLTDVFVHERAAPPSNDYRPPSTTASATATGDAPYTSDTWTNQDVKVTLSAEDNEGGSGIKDIRYSATGAQSIPETVYDDSQSPLVINTDGTTKISYYATDNASNKESPKTFTVKLDKSAPTVTNTTPARGQTGVASNTNLTATFSEKMDPASITNITNSSLTLTNQDGSTIEASVAYDTATNKATLTPNAALDPNATYTATIKSGISGAKDTVGNPLAQDYSWTFTTAAPSCTKRGTSGNDSLQGTSGKDVICGLGGNDTLQGLGSDDILIGGDGNDTLIGGTGNDTLDGGLGTDTGSYSPSQTAVNASLATKAATGEGSDTFMSIENLIGSSQADTLTGDGEANTLTGGGGADTLQGGAGNDSVIGSSGADNLFGEDGNDAINSKDGTKGNDSLDGGAGTDTKVTDQTEKSITGFP
jgi:Tol biopolymer transport system component